MSNPLTNFYRAPKLFVPLPSQGKFYVDDSIVDMPASGELAIYAMTAKDEMIMKNPDALLNGEAVAQVISSCVPAVKDPRKLISNDVDVLLLAIQSATGGDEINIDTNCPKCKESITGVASIEGSLDTMDTLNESYSFKTHDGLTVEIKPYTYDLTIKAGITNFHSTRSLKILAEIDDPELQLHEFNKNFVKVAALNFDLMVDSVASISGTDSDGNDFVVTDRNAIADYLNNCETEVGRKINKEIAKVNSIGIKKEIQITCDACSHEFMYNLNFDPVNFFTASLQEQNQQKS